MKPALHAHLVVDLHGTCHEALGGVDAAVQRANGAVEHPHGVQLLRRKLPLLLQHHPGGWVAGVGTVADQGGELGLRERVATKGARSAEVGL